MPPEEVARARRYAFHFFFRRMIPVGMCHRSSWSSLVSSAFVVRVKDLRALESGGDPGLDVICRGIRGRDPFVFPAEEEG